MVSPSQRRTWVRWVHEAYVVSERTACDALGVARLLPGAANERWAMDFIHDQLADGTAFRVLSIVDLYTRECVGLVPAIQLRADDLVATLSRRCDERGIPTLTQCDKGAEFMSVALDHWCYWHQVRVDFSRPGKPTDNAAIDCFHNSFRRECLTQHCFIDITDAQQQIEYYRSEYKNDRPHSSFGNVPPAPSGPLWRLPPASPAPHKVSPAGSSLGARPFRMGLTGGLDHLLGTT